MTTAAAAPKTPAIADAPKPTARDRIASAKKAPGQIEHMPEWGIDVEIRKFNLGYRSRIMLEGYTVMGETMTPNYSIFYPLILIGSCYDPATGDQIFKSDDHDFINSLDPVPVDRLAKIAMKMNGMGKEGREKNDSESSPSSTTSSPSATR